MKCSLKQLVILGVMLAMQAGAQAWALSPEQQAVVSRYRGGDIAGGDTRRGEALYRKKGASDLSCESCHSVDPRQVGQHSSTGKPIKPLSPLVNVDRFSDAGKVEKWFRRNCNDVFKRECTAQEKADFTRWLAGG